MVVFKVTLANEMSLVLGYFEWRALIKIYKFIHCVGAFMRSEPYISVAV